VKVEQRSDLALPCRQRLAAILQYRSADERCRNESAPRLLHERQRKLPAGQRFRLPSKMSLYQAAIVLAQKNTPAVPPRQSTSPVARCSRSRLFGYDRYPIEFSLDRSPVDALKHLSLTCCYRNFEPTAAFATLQTAKFDPRRDIKTFLAHCLSHLRSSPN